MNIVEKIRKRIMTRQMLEGRIIEEIQITKQEAEQLGDRQKIIDGVKLIVVDKLGDMTKKECFAYIDRSGHKSCYSLKKLYCKNKNCKFYRNDITIQEIEKSIEKYALRK